MMTNEDSARTRAHNADIIRSYTKKYVTKEVQILTKARYT